MGVGNIKGRMLPVKRDVTYLAILPSHVSSEVRGNKSHMGPSRVVIGTCSYKQGVAYPTI